MNQQQFDTLGAEIKAVTEQLMGGMITLTEFLDFMARIKRVSEDATAGLVCPFTGLVYPTVAETDAFMAEFAAIGY